MTNAPVTKPKTAWLALASLATLLLALSLYLVFVVAPVERQMGIVQKIFYFHVGSAYAMYTAWALAALGSAMYLWKRDERWDALGVAGAEVGMVYCAVVLTTGPLWARKAWGVFWTWDPRLTTVLLTGMVYLAYLALRSFGEAGEVEKRFASGLAIVGVPTMYLIHESVQRWRGVHPTVITGKGGGLDPAMKPAFFTSMLLFTVLVILFVHARYCVERARQSLHALDVEAAEAGLLEEP